MKKRYKFIIGVALILAVAAYSAKSYYTPLSVRGEQVFAGDITDSFTNQGQIVPKESILMNSAATGTITGLPFKTGMSVKQGQELVRVNAAGQTELAIQKEQLRQQLAMAEYQYLQLFGSQGQARQQAAVEAAREGYELAERQYQAALDVESAMSGVYTKAELDTLATAVKAARQALVAAEAQGAASADREYYQTMMESTRLQISALEEEQQNEALLAPFDGVVWQLLADEGAFIVKNQPLLKLYRQEQMKVEVSLLTDDSLQIRVGDTAGLRWGDGDGCDATVTFISPVAEQIPSSLGIMENRCIVELEPEALLPELGAGYQVDVLFSRPLAENVLSVPASSIVPVDAGSGVYLAEEGKARLVIIGTGARSGGRVEVISGLSAGDFIIANPYDAGVKDGDRVKIIVD